MSKFAFGYTQKEIDNVERQFEACFDDNYPDQFRNKLYLWSTRWIPK